MRERLKAPQVTPYSPKTTGCVLPGTSVSTGAEPGVFRAVQSGVSIQTAPGPGSCFKRFRKVMAGKVFFLLDQDTATFQLAFPRLACMLLCTVRRC